jgi:ubiquinone/menaquinone biosynthesis C-methylase UbiE
MRPSFELRTEQDVQIPRLFNFDLPPLKKTGKALPELANSSAIHRILDVASGNGEWALRAAQAGPHLQIVGVERDPQLVTYAQAQAQAQRVDNVSFTVMDPFQLSDIADGTFDLVNARFLVGLLSAEDWPKVLREFVRVTRPGGIIRLTENDLPITNSPAYGQLGELISESLYVTKRSFSSEGRLLSAAPTLKRLLRDSGCHDVRQAVSITNFSAGMEAHADIYQDVATTYRLVQPFLVSTKVTTQQDVERLYQQMLTEMQSPDFLAVAFYLTVWGTTS